MECKVCGSVAPDNAVYCPTCGDRVDGKKECPKCGAENAEGFKFCLQCGARIDGKKTCKTCGTEFEGAFCPQCGVKAPKAVCGAKKGKASKPAGSAYKVTMRSLAISFGLLASLVSLIFAFFIGFDGTLENSIFYYFTDTFKEVNLVKESVSGAYYSGAMMTLMYADAIVSCIVAAATLIGVVVFFS